jgi:glucose-1-phosphate adenylyltransferase
LYDYSRDTKEGEMSVLALILAGGRGTGLGILTGQRPKPAVPFGGRYLVIDFALSNLVNSSLNRVAVLAQFNPHSLQEYLGSGEAWGFGIQGKSTLQGQPTLQVWLPSMQRTGQEKYLGTADAVHQNRKFILDDGSDVVVILPGDHICKIDFRQVLRYHQEKAADLTIMVMKVAAQQSAQFGMLEMDADNRITRFVEKPAQSDLSLGSLGVYVFNTPHLLNALEADGRDPASAHDFGQNIIPKLVESGGRVYGFLHQGPWAGISTLHSLWQANLALLGEEPLLDLYDPHWVIHTCRTANPPVKIGQTGRVINSLVADGCVIKGEVIHSVLAPGVRVERGAVVRDAVVMGDTVIRSGARVSGCILDHDTQIYQH